MSVSHIIGNIQLAPHLEVNHIPRELEDIIPMVGMMKMPLNGSGNYSVIENTEQKWIMRQGEYLSKETMKSTVTELTRRIQFGNGGKIKIFLLYISISNML